MSKGTFVSVLPELTDGSGIVTVLVSGYMSVSSALKLILTPELVSVEADSKVTEFVVAS